MIPVFLIGGGWHSETFPQTYGRFLESASENNQRRIALIVAEEPDSIARQQFLKFFKAFESIRLNSADAFSLIVSAENHLSKEMLAEVKPTGVFVCGGLTPAYYDALCGEKSWLEYLFENEIPYCGFSAGASIAAEKAIVGGWQREISNGKIAITNENAGEDLDLLDVRNGLGLVSFAVDVHATQWGTLSRLIHAVDAGLANEGWAIDENTMLEINRNGNGVFGAGNAYRVKRQKGEVAIRVFQSKC